MTDGSWGINTYFLFFFFFFEGASSVKSYFIFAQNWGKTRANTLILKGRGGGGISELVAIKRKYSPLPVEGRGIRNGEILKT